MLITLLQAGQDTSGHFQAGRIVGGILLVAVVLLVVLVIVKKSRERGQLDYRQPSAGFSDADVVEDVIEAVEQPAPRRTVTVPANDSDEGPGRASQQTLKRMSMDEVEQSSSKGPRAGELPENPILPDEVIKIRCLNCDKKMQAEGPKFAKQRRCPNCKAAPFRYVTAV